jgi:hypothetical protein
MYETEQRAEPSALVRIASTDLRSVSDGGGDKLVGYIDEEAAWQPALTLRTLQHFARRKHRSRRDIPPRAICNLVKISPPRGVQYVRRIGICSNDRARAQKQKHWRAFSVNVPPDSITALLVQSSV